MREFTYSIKNLIDQSTELNRKIGGDCRVALYTRENVNRPFEDNEISNICVDSRQVKPGDLFVALRGYNTDSHDYIEEVLSKKIPVVVDEEFIVENPDLIDNATVPVVVTEDTHRCLALLATTFYQFPASELFVIGITGTNGKTTTAYMIEHILGKDCTGLIGTIEHRWPGFSISARNTTPDSLTLQRYLREMVDAGVKNVVMEVSSVALVSARVLGVTFDVVIYTNISPEHLDYHETYENYFEAKKLLFTKYVEASSRMGKSPVAIVNQCEFEKEETKSITECALKYASSFIFYSDSIANGICLVQKSASSRHCNYRLSLSKALVNYWVNNIKNNNVEPFPNGITEGNYQIINGILNLVGSYNLENMMAAFATAIAKGYRVDSIVSRISSLPPIPGRMEWVGHNCYIDYAHTPRAIYEACYSFKMLAGLDAKLYVVLGAGGDRDRKKRIPMGANAAMIANYVIVTNDNPRTEDPKIIANAVAFGVEQYNKPYKIILDRREAIRAAINAANLDKDIVVVLGKGHEEFQQFKDRIEHFSDREEIQQALRLKFNITDTSKTKRIIEYFSAKRLKQLLEQNNEPKLNTQIQNGEGISEADEKLKTTYFTGITTNSRKVSPGNLFIALKGEHFDGHEFVHDAVANGATGVVVEHEIPSLDAIQIVVEQTTSALKEIAKVIFCYAKNEFGLHSIAITGSNGKTTTKELTSWLITEKFGNEDIVLKTEKNHNNRIGLSLTLAELTDKHQYAVLEMGTNHFNELSELIDIAPTDIRVITSIGDAHLESFKDRNGVTKAKSEILENSEQQTITVIPEYVKKYLVDNGLLTEENKEIAYEGRIVTVSETSDLDSTERLATPPEKIDFSNPLPEIVYYKSIPSEKEGYDTLCWRAVNSTIEEEEEKSLKIHETDCEVQAPHWDSNLAIAIASFLALNLDWEPKLDHCLKDFSLPDGRSTIHYFKSDKGELTVVDDAYNSNPTSLLASAIYFGNHLGNHDKDYIRIAVIGQMNELGHSSSSLHIETAKEIAEKGIYNIYYWVGHFAADMCKAAESTGKGKHFSHPDMEDLSDIVENLPEKGMIFLKASRTMKLEKIVDEIRQSGKFQEYSET